MLVLFEKSLLRFFCTMSKVQYFLNRSTNINDKFLRINAEILFKKKSVLLKNKFDKVLNF